MSSSKPSFPPASSRFAENPSGRNSPGAVLPSTRTGPRSPSFSGNPEASASSPIWRHVPVSIPLVRMRTERPVLHGFDLFRSYCAPVLRRSFVPSFSCTHERKERQRKQSHGRTGLLTPGSSNTGAFPPSGSGFLPCCPRLQRRDRPRFPRGSLPEKGLHHLEIRTCRWRAQMHRRTCVRHPVLEDFRLPPIAPGGGRDGKEREKQQNPTRDHAWGFPFSTQSIPSAPCSTMTRYPLPGRSSDFRICRFLAPSPRHAEVAYCKNRPRLQRRARPRLPRGSRLPVRASLSAPDSKVT